MLKRSLAWVLTLALLISSLSGLALITSAKTENKFAYASFLSGSPLYKNAESSIDSVTAHGGSTDMEAISGNAADRYAYFMAYQNDQLGIKVPNTAGLTSSITVEVKFWATEYNVADTRLGFSYTNASGQVDYGKIVMSGLPGTESVTVDAALTGISAEIEGTEGWKTLKYTITDADFGTGALTLNFVKWSAGNAAHPDPCDGWYIQSILAYNTGNRPDDEDLYIREDTVGSIEFTEAEIKKELLDYTAENSSIETVDDLKALKLAKADAYALSVSADDVAQPAVLATDAAVTIMAEYSANGTDWSVARLDITDNNATSFDFGSKLFADETADYLYVRKVVVCRTNLVVTYKEDNTAFVNFDNPIAYYNDFPLVTSVTFNASYEAKEQATGDEYTIAEVQDADELPKIAINAPSGYFNINVDETITKHNGADVADFAITVSYLDKGTGTLKMQYNQQIPAETEDSATYQFVSKDIVTLTDTNLWKTATVYLSDAQFRGLANGGDFRIPMGDIKDSAISSVIVKVGADKAQLNAQIAALINTSKYTKESVQAYNDQKTLAQGVVDNVFATKAQVDAAYNDLKAKFDALELLENGDPRFTLDNAIWNMDETNGKITIVDGWYCWEFTPDSDSKFLGIGDETNVLKDSASVTYEYDIMFAEGSDNNDRCFLGYGTKDSWQGVKEGAFKEDGTGGNGFAAGGQWGETPPIGRWGIITIKNDNFDSTKLSEGRNNVTELGSWMGAGAAGSGPLYVRGIKAYDSEDPTKCVSLKFNENAVDLMVTPSDAEVVLAKRDEADDFESYKIPSGWKSVNLVTENLVDETAGIITKGENNVTVEFEYYLEDTDNGNEMFQVFHYNPDGNGQNGDKASVCEHQYNRGEGMKRNEWSKMTVVLDDANFGNGIFGLKYGNGTALYIRGIKVYATDTPDDKAKWGIMNIEGVVGDHPFYNWDSGESYGMSVSFSEGATATQITNVGDRVGAIVNDDKLYVNLDDKLVTSENSCVRIDLTIQNGSELYVRYNKILPEGTDTSAEPNNTEYNFHASGENEVINEEKTVEEGAYNDKHSWKTTEDDFVNMLGVVKSTGDNTDWITASIYLTDAQFRNAANGNDFRIHGVGGYVISAIDVYVINVEDVPALGVWTDFDQAVADTIAKFGEVPDDETVYDALMNAQDFKKYNYQATQAEIDEAKKALEDAIAAASKLGDVDGDGKVTTTDARMVLQLTANKIKEADLKNAAMAEVDGSAGISTTDARLILQYSAEKITEFPVEAKK